MAASNSYKLGFTLTKSGFRMEDALIGAGIGAAGGGLAGGIEGAFTDPKDKKRSRLGHILRKAITRALQGAAVGGVVGAGYRSGARAGRAIGYPWGRASAFGDAYDEEIDKGTPAYNSKLDAFNKEKYTEGYKHGLLSQYMNGTFNPFEKDEFDLDKDSPLYLYRRMREKGFSLPEWYKGNVLDIPKQTNAAIKYYITDQMKPRRE